MASTLKSHFGYMYVIRMSDGAVVHHPMLALPTDGDDDAIVLNIRVLEKEAEERGIQESMMG